MGVESLLVLEVVRQPAHDVTCCGGGSASNPYRSLHTLGICSVVFGLVGGVAGFMAVFTSLLLVIAGSMAVHSIRSGPGRSGSISEEACCCCCSPAAMRSLLVVVCCVAPLQLIVAAAMVRFALDWSSFTLSLFFAAGVPVSLLHFILAAVFTSRLDRLAAGKAGSGAADASTPLIEEA